LAKLPSCLFLFCYFANLTFSILSSLIAWPSALGNSPQTTQKKRKEKKEKKKKKKKK
jgi:hypothetical protein